MKINRILVRAAQSKIELKVDIEVFRLRECFGETPALTKVLMKLLKNLVGPTGFIFSHFLNLFDLFFLHSSSSILPLKLIKKLVSKKKGRFRAPQIGLGLIISRILLPI